MDNNQNNGGSGPALAAHSKDASAPGQTPASQATGEIRQPPSAPEAGAWLGQAQQAAEQVASSLSDATRQAGGAVASQSTQVTKQATALVQAQPLVTLAVTGVVFLMIGMLIGRR